MFRKCSAILQISKKDSEQSLEIDGTLGSLQVTPRGFNCEKKMLEPPAEVNMVQIEKRERSSLE